MLTWQMYSAKEGWEFTGKAFDILQMQNYDIGCHADTVLIIFEIFPLHSEDTNLKQL